MVAHLRTSASPPPLERWTKTRSDIANALKRDPNTDVTELRRKLKAERLADHVKRVVSEAPALTDEQLASVCALLRDGKKIVRKDGGGA